MNDLRNNRVKFPPEAAEPTRFYDHIHSIPLLRGLSTGRRICTLLCDMEPQDGEPIFVWVHGTWSTRAWTRRHSALLKEISRIWPLRGMYRFVWTGTNGARHRLVAAEVLAEKFQQLAVKYPSSKLVAISHSHGGNVVAWASTVIKKPLSAAIYLNTPFIQVLEPKDFSEARPEFTEVSVALRTILIAVCAPVTWSYSVYLRHWPPAHRGQLDFPSLVVLALLVLVQLFLPSPVVKIARRLSRVSNSVRKISSELVVFAVGDEPAAAFNGIYFIHWLGRRIPSAIFISIGLITVGLAMASLASPKFNKIVEFATIPIICSTVITLASLFLATSAYGLVQGLVALQSPLTVTPAPVGQTNFVTVGWTMRDKLRHSLIYESSDAIKRITDWLRLVLEDQGKESLEAQLRKLGQN